MSAAAKGPIAFLLRSQAGQWCVVSLGAIYAMPEQIRQGLFPMLKDASQWSDNFVKRLSDGDNDKALTATNSPTPIIIHTGNSKSNEDETYYVLIAKYAVTAGACWVGYVVVTNALPEVVKEMMPVTRKFFSKTSKFLADSIIQVQKVLEEKIANLSQKQDQIEGKLDDTHTSVRNVQHDLSETRDDISKLGDSMNRCESTLMSSKMLQSYTSKGVTLLVRCVASMLPTNDKSMNDLAQYIKDGEELGKREQEQRRLSELNGPFISPEPKKTYMIRDSELDSSLHSLEDVHSVLGIGPGGLVTAK